MPRLELDENLCQAHGLCYGGWPELFDARDDGIAIARVDRLAPEQLAAAREAVAACPEQAIRIR